MEMPPKRRSGLEGDDVFRGLNEGSGLLKWGHIVVMHGSYLPHHMHNSSGVKASLTDIS